MQEKDGIFSIDSSQTRVRYQLAKKIALWSSLPIIQRKNEQVKEKILNSVILIKRRSLRCHNQIEINQVKRALNVFPTIISFRNIQKSCLIKIKIRKSK